MILSKKHTHELEDICSIILLGVIFIIIISPIKYSNTVLEGANIFFLKVFPTLFPFFFLSKMLLELNKIQKITKIFAKPFKKCFNLSSSCAYVFFTSILCGYPLGAKLTSDLFESKQISTDEAHRLTALSSTSGPMFIIGTVGAIIFGNIKLGVFVFITHILGAILNGFLFRNYGKTQIENSIKQPQKTSLQNAFIKSTQNALNSILIVGTYIILFYLFIEIFLNIIPFNSSLTNTIFSGFIELTRGTLATFSLTSNQLIQGLLLSFFISFGGLSVHLQCLTFLNKCNIKYKFFFMQKITHALFSCAIFMLLYIFI